MKHIDIIYFPDTDPYFETNYPLLLLAVRLNYLSPVEPEHNAPADIFTRYNLCQAHTPIPLGDERSRFAGLIRDIKLRKDDYADQLKALTIAGMQEAGKEEHKGDILAALLGSSGDDNKSIPGETRRNAVWRARLILALAEILDREEEELAGQLSFLDEQELQLFKRLQGENGEEEDNPFQELMDIQQRLNAPNPAMMKNRCRSWLELAGDKPFSEPAVWLSTREEAADFIFDACREQTGNEPYLLEMINLPASIGRDFPLVADALTDFRQRHAGVIEALAEEIIEPVVSGNAALPTRPIITPSLEKDWNLLLAQEYPENLYGRKKMKIYLLPGFIHPQGIPSKKSGKGSLFLTFW
ncbi:MAG: hypothetical protein CSB24_02465 [Deltaproteobacteria bacterium]|nr:MAG: hypothetical protein CSB24_02465 [Deltaproteobacteria bacterium]